jgi:hypothetical protein
MMHYQTMGDMYPDNATIEKYYKFMNSYYFLIYPINYLVFH